MDESEKGLPGRNALENFGFRTKFLPAAAAIEKILLRIKPGLHG